jgi:hypothetical protein
MIERCSRVKELFDCSRRRQQGRGDLAAQRGFACGGQIIEDVAMLLLE